MTERAYTSKLAPGNVWLMKWSSLGNGDTGVPVQVPKVGDNTVQVYGTFSTGGSVTIQGSNDPSDAASITYATLHKVDLSALTYTAAGMDAIVENVNLIRPSVTAGDGSTNLTVIVCFKGGA